MPQKRIQIRCDQTPSSNQGLQTKRGSSIFWFFYRRSQKKRMHLQYPCVVWNPFGHNSVPFPTSHKMFHVTVWKISWYVMFNMATSLQLFGRALSPAFGNIMNKVSRHMGGKFPLCNIEVKIFNKHLGRTSPPNLNISATKPFASGVFRIFNWRNTCCDSSNENGGISWSPPEQATALSSSNTGISCPTTDWNMFPKNCLNCCAVGWVPTRFSRTTGSRFPHCSV